MLVIPVPLAGCGSRLHVLPDAEVKRDDRPENGATADCQNKEPPQHPHDILGYQIETIGDPRTSLRSHCLFDFVGGVRQGSAQID